MLRFGVAVVSLLAAVSVAIAQWSAWQVGKTTDLASGKLRMVAQLKTTDVSQQSYKRHHGAVLSVFCDDGKPGARIQFLGKVSQSSKVTVRYWTDAHEQKPFQTDTSSDRRSVYLRSGAQAAEFVKRAAASSKLRVHTDAPGSGVSLAQFNTSGAQTAIDQVLKDCRG